MVNSIKKVDREKEDHVFDWSNFDMEKFFRETDKVAHLLKERKNTEEDNYGASSV